MSLLRSLLIILFCSSITLHLTGQAYTVKTEQFTTKDGLSHNAINSMYEDSRGLLWLATRYGVNRFDGHNFRFFTKEDHNIHSNNVQQVLEDHDGVLWLLNGMDGFRIASFGEKWNYTLFDPFLEKTISVSEYLPEELQGLLEYVKLYGQYPNGDLFFINTDLKLINYRARNDYSVGQLPPHLRGRDFVRGIPLSDSLLLLASDHFKADPGKVDFITQEGKIVPDFTSYNFNAPPGYKLPQYFPMHQANEDPFWQLQDDQGETGFYMKVENGRRVFYDLRTVLPRLVNESDIVLSHIGGPDNHYFVRTAEGTLMLKPDSDETTSLPGVDLGRYSFTDRMGNLYAINQRTGLFKYTFTPNLFVRIDVPGRNYRGMTLDAENRLWVAMDRGTKIKPDHKPFAAGGVVFTQNRTVYKDDSGAIWEGITRPDGDGVPRRQFLMRHSGKNYSRTDTFSLDRVVHSGIWEIWQDPENGNIWSANTQGLVFRTDPQTEESVTLPFVNDPRWEAVTLVYSFIRSGDGALWLSTNGGLIKINAQDEIAAVYSADQTGEHYLPASSVHNLYIDSAGVFWIASGDAGLLKWSPDGAFPLVQYTLSDGFPSMVMHASYEDSLGYLWIPTEDGIVQFHKETEYVSVFREADGTSDSEYNRISHYRHHDGYLYFGGQKGITRFHPRDFHRQQRLAQDRSYINLIDVARYDLVTEREESVSSTVIKKGEALVLSPGKPRATLRFLEQYTPGATCFIEGQLIGTGNQPLHLKDGAMLLTDLPYGQHELQLQARTIDGELLERKDLVIIVKRPFYLTLWFLVLLLVATVALARGIAWLENRRLRSLVTERTQQIERDKTIIEQQADELRQLDELKSRFFTNVSHELRTPLTLIMAPINRLLKRADLPPETFHSLRRANNSGRQLQQLIDDILDLSKLEDGSLEVDYEATPLLLFLRRTVMEYESLAVQYGNKLSFSSVIGGQTVAEIDRAKVKTIVQNLVSNAIKFTPAGGAVGVTAEFAEGALSFTVADTGPGIDARDLPFLFDRFYQARHGRKPVEGGTGIGLSICQELARLMGGTLKVESVLEEGTRFQCSLPASLSEQAEVATVFASGKEPLSVTPLPVGKQVSPSILLVEDNPDLKEYITEILAGEFAVYTATNGRLALDLLEAAAPEELPDLILTDIMMPVMDGLTLLRHLKQLPLLSSLPVIVLSARSASGDRLNALRIGIDDYILKPFEEDELKQRIRNLLANVATRSGSGSTEGEEEAGKVDAETITPEDEAWLRKVSELVRSNIKDDGFGNEELARLLFVSSRTLSRRTKSITGLTLNKFILEIRLEAARGLLEDRPRPTLSAVAAEVGFKKTSYFSTRFRERFGVLPSEYAG